MDVQVRHALADDVVEGDERSGLPHRLRHGDREEPGAPEERPDQVVGQVGERLVVVTGDEQQVAWEQRPVVEEGERALILEDDVGGLVAGDDLTEAAIRVPGGQVRDTVKRGEEP